MKSRSFNVMIILALLLSLLSGAVTFTPARAAGLCYVNMSASGLNNGTSWTNAYIFLQSAIADSCTEIWVAAGYYIPHDIDRSVSFVLENGTAIYGGFAGTETLRTQRDFAANITVLSGNIGNSGIPLDNSYHVVRATAVNSTAVLDGFTIADGYAFSSQCCDERGGGMYNSNSSTPTLTNIIFYQNYASGYGGGI